MLKPCWKLKPMPFCPREGGSMEYGGPRSAAFLLAELVDKGRDVGPKKLLVRKGGSLCMLRGGGGDMFWENKKEENPWLESKMLCDRLVSASAYTGFFLLCDDDDDFWFRLALLLLDRFCWLGEGVGAWPLPDVWWAGVGWFEREWEEFWFMERCDWL
jgi:hypothetical protein